MCGIVGIVGSLGPVAQPIMESLRRLEYRGYDSAGIATLVDGHIERRRAAGKLSNLADVLLHDPLPGNIGIGHTRWATHGGPTTNNAHPHATLKVAVVHNGIIENFRDLRAELQASGTNFQSETDTEIVAHLVTKLLADGHTPLEAARLTFSRLEGGSALVLLFADHPGLLIGGRLGRALAVGRGTGEMYLGSDALALAPFTNQVAYLEDGDIAEISATGVQIINLANETITRPFKISSASATLIDKGEHRHFMSKEIFEQPEVVGYTLSHYLDPLRESLITSAFPTELADITKVTLTACGTAYYACLVAKNWIEELARVPVDVDVASEFRYREPPMPERGLAVAVSQSGETADTLAAIRYCKQAGQIVAAVVNVPESSIAREADFILPTLAGAEIGVASTKAFTCQLSALVALALAIAKAKGRLDADQEARFVRILGEVPRLIQASLKANDQIKAIAHDIAKARDVLFLGRGGLYPIALEGALKLKEISYIHAEGYAAGEMKHGPIALIDESVPVVVLAPSGPLFDKLISNLQEASARGGRILLVADHAGLNHAGDRAQWTIQMPAAAHLVQPILATIPLQLLAYHTAVARGTDVDQPRNLAKSVTVE